MLDVITTLLESFLVSYGVNYFCNNKKIDKKTFFISFLLIAIIQSNTFLQIFNQLWVRISICVLLNIVIISIIYRHNILRALTAESIIMLSILSIMILMQNNVYGILAHIVSPNIDMTHSCLIIFFVRWLNVFLQLKYIDTMYKFYEAILAEGVYLLIVILFLSLLVISAICCFNSVYGIDNEILKNTIVIVLYIFLLLVLFYIMKISAKSREIHKLNLDLEFNNNNLRKIKHDYGAQISYLYGLCLMGRIDDLKEALKDIIDKSNYASHALNSKSDSILSLALKQAVDDEDIKIKVDDKAKLYLLDIPEIDLFRVLFNIAHNAVEAMNGKGEISAKSYETDNEIVITIQNDGPEIPKKFIREIFNTGFTTKSNTEKEHGYGLSIVKDLVEKYNGEIYVDSSPELTEFKIIFRN